MRRWKIGSGDSAIHKTIKHMKALVLGPEGVGHPAVRIAAIDAARGSIKNVSEIDAVLSWVKQHIEFRGENAETLQSPVVTLQLGAGDCDDHSTLIAAMLRSLGYNVQFKTVATSRMAPGMFSHVYPIVQDKRTGQWVPLDSTVPTSFAGWEPPMIFRQQTYPMPRLGDDVWSAVTNPTGINPPGVYAPPLVPAPPAPAGLGPKSQFAYNLLAPITQAYASQIAHGTTPVVTGNVNLGLTGGGGLPTWVWLVLGGGFLWLMTRPGRSY